MHGFFWLQKNILHKIKTHVKFCLCTDWGPHHWFSNWAIPSTGPDCTSKITLKKSYGSYCLVHPVQPKTTFMFEMRYSCQPWHLTTVAFNNSNLGNIFIDWCRFRPIGQRKEVDRLQVQARVFNTALRSHVAGIWITGTRQKSLLT